MTPLDIQYELKKAGVMQKDLVAGIDFHAVNTTRFIQKRPLKRGPSKKADIVMRRLCKAINRTPEEVFPEYYPWPPESAKEN